MAKIIIGVDAGSTIADIFYDLEVMTVNCNEVANFLVFKRWQSPFEFQHSWLMERL